MTCRELERLLEAWLAGELSSSERAACERHAATCEHCRELAEVVERVRAAEALPDAEPPGDLVPGILERTSGAACARARTELAPLVDGELAVERRELVELHLAACPDCRSLRDVLAGLAIDLPRLAEVDPGPGFVDGVLEHTVRAERPVVRPSVPERLRRWWAATWPGLVRRPRFAWEVAYVLALVLTPLVASADLPARAADLATRAGRAGAVTVATAAQDLAEGAGGVAERAGSLGASAESELRTFRRRFASSLEKGRGDGPDNPDDSNPSKGEAP